MGTQRGLFTVVALAAFGAAGAAGPLPKIRIAPDGRTFETEPGRPFVPIGANYFRPGTGWAPQVWKQFDAEAVRQDFARMRELGVNCVRVFLTYGSFYDEPGKLNREGLEKFDRFLEMAEEAGIYVHPTGPDHWEGTPAWVPERYLGDTEVRAEFWKQFAARYRGRNVIFAYDLLNEPLLPWDAPPLREEWGRWLKKRYGNAADLAQAWGAEEPLPAFGKIPPPAVEKGGRALLDYQTFREEQADVWVRRQVEALKAADPEALVTVGLIQWSVPSKLSKLQEYAAFRPSRLAPFLDFLEVHFYPLERGGYRYEGEAAETRNLAYLESVVREVAAPGKPVVLAEFGWYGGGLPRKVKAKAGTPAPSEEQQAQWCRKAVETTAGLACGWLCWGLYDIPESTDCSQFSGMLAADGRTKAWGREFQKLAAHYAGRHLPPAQLPGRPAMDWDACVTGMEAIQQFREEYIRAFGAARKR
jgi:hypothetical protein